RLGDQLVRRRLVEVELPLDDGVQLVALGVGNVAVDGSGMHKQRRRREAIVVVLEADRMLAAFRRLGQKSAKAIEHAAVPLDGATLHAVSAKSRGARDHRRRGSALEPRARLMS